jgi:hypothetical protein
VGLPVLGVIENMAGLQQRLDGVRFLMPPSAAAAGASAAGGAASASGGSGAEDVTDRVLAALAGAGLGDPRALLAAVEVFAPSGGGAGAMCARLGLQLLGRVPLDPGLGAAAEEGRAVGGGGAGVAGGGAEPPSCLALRGIVETVRKLVGDC